MRVGDKYPVTIAGQVVTQATIREVGDGTATLLVPGTVVVMATRTELTDTPREQDTSGTETVIDSVERTSANEETPEPEAPVAQEESTEPAEQSAPVVDDEK